MTQTKRNLPFFLLICLVTALLCGCAGSSTIIRELREGNTEKANALYFEKIQANPSAEEKFSQAYMAELTKIYDQLNNGEISYDTANSLVRNFNAFSKSDLFSDLTENISSLAFSKQMFESAESSMAEENYLAAIFSYTSVLPEDTNRETARERRQEAYNLFVEAALAKAESCAQEGDYTGAMDVLVQARADLQGSIAIDYGGELDDKYMAYYASQTALDISEYMDAAHALQNNGDYLGAIEKLRQAAELWPAEETVTDALADARCTYANAVLDDAAGRFTDNQDYAGAMAILEVAADEMDDEKLSDLLTRAYTYYQSFEPVSLLDLEPFYYDGEFDRSGTKITDNLDQTYNEYIQFRSSGFFVSNEYTGQVTYKVSAYNHLSCRVILDQRDLNSEGGSVNVYLDGNLTYESPTIAKGVDPVDIEVDLNGAVELSIEMIYHTYTSIALVNSYLYRSTEGAQPFSERA